MVAHSPESRLPQLILCLLPGLGMIASVHFYYQSSVARNEIYDIISYDMLAKEILPARFLIPKVFPKPLLSLRCILSVFPRIRSQYNIPVRR